MDDGRPYYYPQDPEPEAGNEDDGNGQDNDPNTGSVPDQKVEVTIEGDEGGENVSVDIIGGGESNGDDSMVTGIDIELGSDVKSLGVNYSQSSASS